VPERPNILFVMADQQRFDTIAALGNPLIYTPHLDRLVARGVSFTRAYSTCPVCVPARYTIRTGCEPPRTASYQNGPYDLVPGQDPEVEGRCGPFLARRLSSLGYRTFGIGKCHALEQDLGYDLLLRAEELWGSEQDRAGDAFASFIAAKHPEFSFLEQLHGERTEMYYMPQASPLPAALTYESWAADRACELLSDQDSQPFFGFVSFIRPHPPLAPPLPFNRMYDPDRMPHPVLGDLATDHLDEQIPWMNYAVWAEDVGPAQARVLKARYYGAISYLDHCLGRILDALEARPDARDTLVCFFSDHGDHLGDHYAWQKESFFEASCRVPFLVSWPARLPQGAESPELACLTDLFGLATAAAGTEEVRDGISLLGLLERRRPGRDRLLGYYGCPGTPLFKVMVRETHWKYVYLANGGRELLFNVTADPQELRSLVGEQPAVAARLRAQAIAALRVPNADRALAGDDLRAFPFQARPLRRIVQMDRSRGVTGFPARPQDVLETL